MTKKSGYHPLLREEKRKCWIFLPPTSAGGKYQGNPIKILYLFAGKDFDFR